jgi:hypothetical protein
MILKKKQRKKMKKKIDDRQTIKRPPKFGPIDDFDQQS